MRKDRLIQEKIHDPYYEEKKYPDGVVCPNCQAIYRDGRWVWPEKGEKIPPNSDEYLCPACRRIRDKYPAGVVVFSGSYFEEHREEILNLVNNIIEEEIERSPVKKLINTEETEEGLVFNFTDDSLARRVGEAVARAHKGELEMKYLEGAKFIYVAWQREK
ncbi:MAG: 60S ribosomal export protein NMD3 [Candidatus Desulfofervidus auxilii]|nr:60S ribosomal export protein NMD3 [Candidatus Desulfofervidus auxilii]